MRWLLRKSRTTASQPFDWSSTVLKADAKAAKDLGRRFANSFEFPEVGASEINAKIKTSIGLESGFSSIVNARARRIYRKADFTEIEQAAITRYRAALIEHVEHGIVQRLENRVAADAYGVRKRAEEKAAHTNADARRQVLAKRPAAPQPHPLGVSPRGAETLVAQWMRHLGVIDAYVTQYSRDGGIDVESRSHVAQVKHITGAVKVSDVRALHGVGVSMRKQSWFFTSTRYTEESTNFADHVGMALFVYSAERGTLRGANATAVRLCRMET